MPIFAYANSKYLSVYVRKLPVTLFSLWISLGTKIQRNPVKSQINLDMMDGNDIKILCLIWLDI